ncbi:MAG: hypothetical protein JSV16_11250 [Candidatus Hydrogenedentota bacterium]|nr:MAG: hypothetical protein JSV16_11250 [Candidatus Hydrogenedentota bacterium]
MKTLVRLMLISMLVICAVSAYSDECVQMWKCEMDDDTTEEQVIEMAHKWLNAAKAVKGGEQFKAYVYFPVAVNFDDESDFILVVIAPSFEAWGTFWDNYHGSKAEELEGANLEAVICPDSAVWERVAIK